MSATQGCIAPAKRMHDFFISIGTLSPVRPGLALSLAGLVAATACSPSDDGVLVGYIEADYVYVAAPASGWLVSPPPGEGTMIAEGQALFALDTEFQQAARSEAQMRLNESEARLQDLETGARDVEIEALEAQLHEAEAALELARMERERWTKLADRGVASEARRDQVVAEEESAEARVETLQKNIETAKLAGREGEVAAAAAARNAAAAALDQAQWRLDERNVVSRTAGRIEEVFHRQGEYVAAGTAVLAVLPPTGLKVRFYAPQDRLPGIDQGAEVEISVDGTEKIYDGKIFFIAGEAEFTPPVIYTAETRDKLVFLVEN